MLGQVIFWLSEHARTENMLRHIEHTRRLENIQLMSCISESIQVFS